MMKFDNAKYRTVLNLIKKTGEFKGKSVPSKATHMQYQCRRKSI